MTSKIDKVNVQVDFTSYLYAFLAVDDSENGYNLNKMFLSGYWFSELYQL